MNANTRKWIYDVLSVLGPALVFYGVLSGEEFAMWLGIAGTLLQSSGTVLARKNLTPDVPTVEPKHIQLVELSAEGLEGIAYTVSRNANLPGHRVT